MRIPEHLFLVQCTPRAGSDRTALSEAFTTEREALAWAKKHTGHGFTVSILTYRYTVRASVGGFVALRRKHRKAKKEVKALLGRNH